MPARPWKKRWRAPQVATSADWRRDLFTRRRVGTRQEPHNRGLRTPDSPTPRLWFFRRSRPKLEMIAWAETTLYVTLEPAAVRRRSSARVPRLVTQPTSEGRRPSDTARPPTPDFEKKLTSHKLNISRSPRQGVAAKEATFPSPVLLCRAAVEGRWKLASCLDHFELKAAYSSTAASYDKT